MPASIALGLSAPTSVDNFERKKECRQSSRAASPTLEYWPVFLLISVGAGACRIVTGLVLATTDCLFDTCCVSESEDSRRDPLEEWHSRPKNTKKKLEMCKNYGRSPRISSVHDRR